MLSPRLQHAAALLTLFYSATLWGLFWYPFRLLEIQGIEGLIATCLAYLLPLVLLGWWSVAELKATRSAWLWLCILGVTSGWSNVGYVLGVLEGEVMRVLLLFYLSPLWTVLFAHLLLGERLNRIGWLVMVLSLLGAGVMLWQDDGHLPLPTNRAEWLGLSAGVTFALSIVAGRHLGATVSDGLKTVAVWFGVSLLTGLGWLVLQIRIPWQAFTASTLLLLVGLAAAIGSVTYAVQYGIARIPASRSNVIFLFELIVAAIAAYWLTDERMELNEWLGAGLILGASLLSGRMHEK